MTIRVLDERDATAWWHLRLEALTKEPYAFGMAAEEHREKTIGETELRFRNFDLNHFTVGAFENQPLIGCATFYRERGQKERHKGRIFGVYVSDSNRRQGAGRAMLRELIAKAAQSETLEQILLSVSTCQEAARSMYQQLGFTTYGTEPQALKIGSDYVDEDLMILMVRPKLTV